MSEEEQFNPLAPAAHRPNEEDFSQHFDQLHRRKSIQFCGCVAAVILLLSVTVIVLFFTVFRVHDPTLRINSVTIQRLETANGTLRTDVNITLLADVSVKNSNVADFKITNTTTFVYYNGTLVGEARHFSGAVKARRTLRGNVTVELISEKITAVPRFWSDFSLGSLTLSSFSSISGRIKILKIIKKHLMVKLDCFTTCNIKSKGFQGETTCKTQHVYF